METATTDLPTQEQPPVFNLKRLLRRAWTILFKEPWGKGRVSRGELLISSLLLGLLVTAITVPLSWISISISSIVGSVLSLRGFGYSFRRVHDLGKSKKYLLIPVIGLVVVGLVRFGVSLINWGMYATLPDAMSPGFYRGYVLIVQIVLGIIALVFFIWYIVVLWNLLFRKGTVGDNAYGIDPLLMQPKGNGLYRRAALLLLGVIMLLSLFENKPAEPDFGDFAEYVDKQADMQAQIEEQIQAAADQAALDEQPSE